MKVVLFCGGFGMRLRGYVDAVPKPLVEIGNWPIMIHIMKYYACFGHKDFILCLGWKADVIRHYFEEILETNSSGIIEKTSGISRAEISTWNINLVDTGLHSSIGERLKHLEDDLRDEQCFLANYTDGLCNVDLNALTAHHNQSGAVASFVSVRPTHSFHVINSNESGQVTDVSALTDKDLWMNGGFFTMSGEIFQFLNEGEELVEKPFQRLIREGRLSTYRHDDFWSCMDTYKEMQALEEAYERGESPWEVWKKQHRPVFKLRRSEDPIRRGGVCEL
ncbi:MAG: sugar phosphate nucleotidyltransferase [Planctomycetota bacterium]